METRSFDCVERREQSVSRPKYLAILRKCVVDFGVTPFVMAAPPPPGSWNVRFPLLSG